MLSAHDLNSICQNRPFSAWAEWRGWTDVVGADGLFAALGVSSATRIRHLRASVRGRRAVAGLLVRDPFLCLAFAPLMFRASLRDIETCLCAVGPKLSHAGFRGRVSRSTQGAVVHWWSSRTGSRGFQTPSPRRGGPGRGEDRRVDSPLAPLPNPPRRWEGTRTSDSNDSFVRCLICLTTNERLHPARWPTRTAFTTSGFRPTSLRYGLVRRVGCTRTRRWR